MKSLAALGLLLAAVAAAIASTESSPASPNGTQPAEEEAAILAVIESQAAAFWAKDFQRWSDTWVHAPYVRRLGWSDPAGVVNVEGWDAVRSGCTKAVKLAWPTTRSAEALLAVGILL